jgi:hypothetical protein
MTHDPDDPWAELAAAASPPPAPGAGAGGRGSGTAGPPPSGRPLETAAPSESVPGALVPEVVEPEAPVVPVPPEAQLRDTLTAAHLSLPGAHERALGLLADVADGKVTSHHVARDGTVVEVPADAKMRVSAAKALLDHAARLTKGSAINVEHANILSVGDLMTRVDPERLRAAVEKMRGGQQ